VGKRHGARRQGRWRAVAGLILLAAVGYVALYVWRGMQGASLHRASPAGPARLTESRQPSPGAGEEFSEAERRGLEEILRRRGAGTSP